MRHSRFPVAPSARPIGWGWGGTVGGLWSRNGGGPFRLALGASRIIQAVGLGNLEPDQQFTVIACVAEFDADLIIRPKTR